MTKYNRYTRFRQDTYQLLGNAKDATFDLMDSIMTTRNAYCLGDLSLSPSSEGNGIVHTNHLKIVVPTETS
ncbi:MAG UNVERIFIED_CONTAM: hypothetical protein LVR29_14610 [Microcystis novacekii LVE1205-3]|jgi:hypothetical protein